MTTKRLTEDEFLDEVRGFRTSAFRFEAQRSYALGYEQADFERFLAGSPVPPPELDWWRPWLERVSRWAREGKTISRVRVLDEPPTDYQRWLLWADPWHAAAGEVIRYMPRAKADNEGLPLNHDWWLLDHERVITMWFTSDGQIESKYLITDPESIADTGVVSSYRLWRDVALWNATPARRIAAA